MTETDVSFSENNASSQENGELLEDALLNEAQAQNAPNYSDGFDQENEVIHEPLSNNDGLSSIESILCDSEKDGEENSSCHSVDIALEQILEKLNDLDRMFTAKIDRSEYELETLKKQSEEMQEYKADLHASILAPVLKPLARTHAFMKRAITKAHSENTDSIPLAEFEFAFDDLSEVIEDSGVEVRSFEEGSPFEANLMKITGQNKVSEADKNKTVNSATSDAYILKGTVLEKARTIVNVFSDEVNPAV